MLRRPPAPSSCSTHGLGAPPGGPGLGLVARVPTSCLLPRTLKPKEPRALAELRAGETPGKVSGSFAGSVHITLTPVRPERTPRPASPGPSLPGTAGRDLGAPRCLAGHPPWVGPRDWTCSATSWGVWEGAVVSQRCWWSWAGLCACVCNCVRVMHVSVFMYVMHVSVRAPVLMCDACVYV